MFATSAVQVARAYSRPEQVPILPRECSLPRSTRRDYRPDRRRVIATLPFATLALSGGAGAAPSFGEVDVSARARELSRQPYKAPSPELPPVLEDVDYDGYRDVNFDPERALWKSDGLPFQLQFFHRGGLHRNRVEIHEVRDGRPVAIPYSPDHFRSNSGAPTRLSPDLGFAGFRIHAPINRASYFDEVAVFLGASYFRAVAKGMVYGLSARGLALGAGEPDEEFPAFRAFWITRPDKGAQSLEILALMDSPSCTGAFRFVVTPGETTIFDTRARLFPRRARSGVGIAPLTSMFLFGPEGGRRFDEERPQIHDSDGLAVAGAQGERLWRPLTNPAAVQSSVLAGPRPAGFGLMQRERRPDAYDDPLARYELRPSLWVEPAGDWGAGEVRLLELPAHTEYQDNVVAMWAPAAGLTAGVEARFAYRLHWGPEARAGVLARTSLTRCDAEAGPGRSRLLVEFELPRGLGVKALTADVRSDVGAVVDVALDVHRDRRAARLTFQIDPGASRTANLRAVLLVAGKPCSEVWLYRWTA